MTETLRMEAQRIRTLTPVWLLALVAVALGVVAALFVVLTPPRGTTLSTEDTRAVLTGASSISLLPFVGLPMIFVGVLAVSEDRRHRLATVLLVAQPRRTTLMTARLAVLTGIALGVGLVQVSLCAAASTALERSLLVGVIPRVLLLHLTALVLFSWCGAALGWLTNSAAVPVGLVLLEALLLEPLAKIAGAEYSDDLEHWSGNLPFAVARDALTMDARPVAYALGYVAVLLTAAWLTVRARDY